MIFFVILTFNSWRYSQHVSGRSVRDLLDVAPGGVMPIREVSRHLQVIRFEHRPFDRAAVSASDCGSDCFETCGLILLFFSRKVQCRSKPRDVPEFCRLLSSEDQHRAISRMFSIGPEASHLFPGKASRLGNIRRQIVFPKISLSLCFGQI